MKLKNLRFLEWLIIAFLIATVFMIGYRVWLVSQADWSDFYSRMRPVDYMVTVIILFMLFVLRSWAKPKP